MNSGAFFSFVLIGLCSAHLVQHMNIGYEHRKADPGTYFYGRFESWLLTNFVEVKILVTDRSE